MYDDATLAKINRKRSKLDVTYDYGDGKRIEFSGPEPLGADDLRILQGLVAMAGPNGLVLGPEPKTEGGRQLRLFLEPKWEAVMGGGQHVRISMDEVRALDSETARLLHQRLCGWIDPGKTGKASIDTLCGYVWPSEASGSTMRKRRQRVREALPELVALGWTVTEFAAGKYDITRPKAAG